MIRSLQKCWKRLPILSTWMNEPFPLLEENLDKIGRISVCALMYLCLLISPVSLHADNTVSQKYLNEGMQLYDEGRFLHALIPLFRAIEQDSSNSDAYFYRGQALEKLSYLSEAQQAYTRACELSEQSRYCERAESLAIIIQGSSKENTASKNICLLKIFSKDYKKIEEAQNLLLNKKAYFPDVAVKQSDLKRITDVECYQYENLEAFLKLSLDTLSVGQYSGIIPAKAGYFLIMKLFEGPESYLAQKPWDNVLSKQRRELGIADAPPINFDSLDVARSDTTQKNLSRRSRRGNVVEADSVDSIIQTPEQGEPDDEKTTKLSLKDIYSEPKFIPYDVAPVAIETVQPDYPDNGKNLKGDVILHVLVDETGAVINTKVMTNFDPDGTHGFADAAMNAIRQWKYSPALWRNEPLAVWITQKISFKLPE